MDEYIKRETAVRMVMAAKWGDGSDGAMAMEIVASAPTADVAPVRHGQWIYDKKAQRPYCSVCKGYFYGATNSPMSYCPNCGAKMDGGDSDEAD